ncbi:MAG: hypothetical protein VB079_00880 [Petrimonas sp.]|jgi:hypothetical protein|nr:hypothetical protein [Dysgonamonadaceae bacterium]MDD4697783.1 hypothetical protein [Fermentimonas sp.]MEA4995024.1 hypothetical protein [Petrimonas sp.]MDD3310143.1 hypothetical protein [Dysgonamonadaceae bacterium]MDD3901474.1 hypothetical protein [Dysgonamonadaceae bacterium]
MNKILNQLSSALETSYGWFLTCVTALAALFQPEVWGFIVVGLSVLGDLIWGIASSVKLKTFIVSRALRETLKKIGIYSFALVGVFLVEKIIHEEGHFIVFRTVAVFASVCELWSMSASMLIIKPDMPFLRLFRAQLKGEIESKLSKHIDINEVLGDQNSQPINHC